MSGPALDAVLVVDDSLTVRMDLDQAFRSAGFATTLCGTCAAAREALVRSPFALIVLDVVLPDADGVEFLRELKSAPGGAEVPVMLLSTEAEVADRIRGLRTGAEEYIGKPYDSAYVVAKARSLLRHAAPRPAWERPILVVDDSATFRESLSAALREHGYSVQTASSGEEALRAAVAMPPRAVVVDAGLPGIDGHTVLRRLREDAVLRRIPCLLLTASEDSASETAALDAGADTFVRKSEPLPVILALLGAALRSGESGTDPVQSQGSAGLLSPRKILAVDDSPSYLHMLADRLRQESYEPILARSGEEALELMAVESVDCVLMDLQMPGISGHETCSRIKASPGWRDVPVVMLTAHEDRETLIEGINAGADDYIPKSGDFEVLLARLRAQLRRKQFEDENRLIRRQLLAKELDAAEARAARELSEVREKLLAELEAKNRDLEAFGYSVSHDLRAPLRAMEGFSRILLEDHGPQLDEEGKRVLQVVVDNTHRMGSLVDGLLDFFRLGNQALHPVATDMAALARASADELLAPLKARAVELHIGELPPARVDPQLFKQVFQNLLSNALKYSSKRQVAHVQVSGRVEADLAIFSISDNGVGFSMEHSKKLFRVFQRLHSQAEFEGTGVGLALTHKIVERHGGSIWAEANPGQGAVFSFSAPASGVPQEAAQGAAGGA